MNQNAQTERYKLLVSHLNSYQRNDCYYSSACFLLSTDSRLTELSLPHISHDGIDFLAIKRKMSGWDDMRKNVIDIAYSLFHCGPRCRVPPHDIAALPCLQLDAVISAMLISQGRAEVLIQEGEMRVSFDKYHQQISMQQEYLSAIHTLGIEL